VSTRKLKTMTMILHLLAFLSNKTHKDDQEEKEEDHIVAQQLTNDLFIVI